MSIDQRLLNMEISMQSMQETNSRIADALERLVILETQHAETREAIGRAFRESEKIDERLTAIEHRLPLINAVVYGAGVAVLGALAAIGASILKVLGLAAGGE